MTNVETKLRTKLRKAVEPSPAPISVDAVADRVRIRRRRLTTMASVGALAIAIATAGVVAVGVTQHSDSGGLRDGVVSGPSGMFTASKITYANGSTIHYGDQAIDVSPHQVFAFVQTDDGFVFVDENLEVNVTDGSAVAEIGHVEGFTGDLVLAADDTGSYVGWIDGDDAVVYDTAKGAEALRAPVWPGADGERTVAAIDGEFAYVQSGNGVDVWNLVTQSKTTTITRSDPRDVLGDVANGYYLWHHFNGSSVVSRDPDAQQPVFGKIIGEDEAQLSPDATYVAGSIMLFERATQRDITPRETRPLPEVKLQWLDDERYVADTDNMHTSARSDPHDLLICTASTDTCRAVVESLGDIVYPDGIAQEGAWEQDLSTAARALSSAQDQRRL